MDSSLFLTLALACAPLVDTGTARALVATESSFNPHAIGVVGGSLLRQPRHLSEALATARALQTEGWNFSLGLAQINVHNLDRLGLNLESAFDACSNLTAMQTVLGECFARASSNTAAHSADQTNLRRALSCYYSGNVVTGFRHGYVRRVVASVQAAAQSSSIPVTPTEAP